MYWPANLAKFLAGSPLSLELPLFHLWVGTHQIQRKSYNAIFNGELHGHCRFTYVNTMKKFDSCMRWHCFRILFVRRIKPVLRGAPGFLDLGALWPGAAKRRLRVPCGRESICPQRCNGIAGGRRRRRTGAEHGAGLTQTGDADRDRRIKPHNRCAAVPLT